MILLRFCFAALFVVLIAGVGIAQTDSSKEKLWCEYIGDDGPGSGRHIVLIAGDDEYRSEEALPMLGKILAVHHGFKCTVLFPVNKDGMVQPNFQENIPGLSALKTADLVIMGLRFRNLPEEQLALVDEYLESGKPLMGIRTSTHAFRIKDKQSQYARYSFNHRGDGWDGGFGQKVFGDTWVSHHGKHGKESTRGIVNEKLANHPVNLGVKDVWGPSDVYEVNKLGDSCNVLMFGQILDGMKPESTAVTDDRNSPMMPLAWTKNYQTKSGQTARVFCTTMGAATDFESEGLRRLMVNASFWALGLEAKIRPDLDVSVVDAFNPTNFGFKNFKTGRKPAFYDLKKHMSEKK